MKPLGIIYLTSPVGSPELTDREIVIAVAEKVMGWTVASSMRHAHSLLHLTEYPDGLYRNYPNGTRRLWNPLTDPAAWDRVLDRMAELGWLWLVRKTVSHGFQVDFWKLKGADVLLNAIEHADTKGRAICLAALKAVEGIANG